MTTKRIAIIGAGFSGISLAINLQNQTQIPLEIFLLGTPENFTLGAAYSTTNASHVLNVPAKDMSMFADQPNHFVSWLTQHPETQLYLEESDHLPTQFIPRLVYGQYMQSQIAIAKTKINTKAQIHLIPKCVNSLIETNNQIQLTADDEEHYQTDFAILATGNSAPKNPFPHITNKLYLPNPWNYPQVETIPNNANVLIIGTGLTMIDVCLTLQDQNHTGKIFAFSPRGLMPKTHSETPITPYNLSLKSLPNTTLERLKLFRKIIAELKDWRSLMDGCRPIVQQLWTSLPDKEKIIFIRHCIPYWDTHRHRIAPKIAKRLQTLKENHQLSIHKGLITDLQEEGDEFIATVKPKNNSKSYQIDIQAVVNCCGPHANPKMVNTPLYSQLFSSGIVKEDSMKMGFAIDENNACLNEKEVASKRLFAMGPICKGTLWETIAIPDLNSQSLAIAKTITNQTLCD
jgi:uncharacterized NAD(P)/FAD-binding protein YdhS